MNIVVFGFGYTARRFAALRPEHRYSCTWREPLGASKPDGRGITAFPFASGDGALRERIADAEIALVSIPPDALGDPTLRRFADELRAASKLRRVVYLLSLIHI